MRKTIDYYLSLPYRLEIVPDTEEGGFGARYPELPGCITCSDTMEGVIANAIDAKRAWLEAALEEGTQIAEPAQEADQPVLVTNIPEGDFDEVAPTVRQAKAMIALNNMRTKAAKLGLLSDDEIEAVIVEARKDEFNDARFLAIATERMSSYNPATTISQEEIDQRLGITEEEIENVGEIEFE